jgi:hypothetical protein
MRFEKKIFRQPSNEISINSRTRRPETQYTPFVCATDPAHSRLELVCFLILNPVCSTCVRSVLRSDRRSTPIRWPSKNRSGKNNRWAHYHRRRRHAVGYESVHAGILSSIRAPRGSPCLGESRERDKPSCKKSLRGQASSSSSRALVCGSVDAIESLTVCLSPLLFAFFFVFFIVIVSIFFANIYILVFHVIFFRLTTIIAVRQRFRFFIWRPIFVL